jgi:hypothetical protein
VPSIEKQQSTASVKTKKGKAGKTVEGSPCFEQAIFHSIPSPTVIIAHRYDE